MFRQGDVTVEIAEAENQTLIVEVRTPKGVLRIVGDLERVARTLRITGVHVEGMRPGALGRSGLNAIGSKLLEEADVDEIIIEGGTRTTGRMPGRAPRVIRFPRT